MSISALNWALNIHVESSSQKLVLLLLANYADEQGRSWPSQKVIAEKACLSVRSVITALGDLEAVGFIKREARWRPGGSRGTDIIHLVMDGSNVQKLHVGSKGEESAPLTKHAKSVDQTCKIRATKRANSSPLTTFEPPVEPSKTRSEATASAPPADAAEAVDLSDRDRLWFEGRPLLIECGLSHSRAGEIIGRWIAVYADAVAILAAIRRARSEATQAPIPFVVAVLEGPERRARASPAPRPRSGGQFLADLVNGRSTGGSDDTGSDARHVQLRIVARTCH